MNVEPCLAWAEAVQAIGIALGVEPIPSGIVRVAVGDWDLLLNNSNAPIAIEDCTVRAFEIRAIHRHFVRVAIMGPDGGAFGGYTEGRFIADMRINTPKSEWMK